MTEGMEFEPYGKASPLAILLRKWAKKRDKIKQKFRAKLSERSRRDIKVIFWCVGVYWIIKLIVIGVIIWGRK